MPNLIVQPPTCVFKKKSSHHFKKLAHYLRDTSSPTCLHAPLDMLCKRLNGQALYFGNTRTLACVNLGRVELSPSTTLATTRRSRGRCLVDTQTEIAENIFCFQQMRHDLKKNWDWHGQAWMLNQEYLKIIHSSNDDKWRRRRNLAW